MASDVSSGCIDDIAIFDEKEEGEISLEDVSSSEESHPNYRSGFRAAGRCPICAATQQCASWCSNARASHKSQKKRDAAHGKENRRHAKESSGTISKHAASTLQEKNDDLVPISSDSDMEIVGLPGNSTQLAARLGPATTKVRKKKRKERNHSSLVRVEELSSPTEVETYLIEMPTENTVRGSKSRHEEPTSPRYGVRSPTKRTLVRSPSRRYRARPLESRSPSRRSRPPLPRANATTRKSPRKLRSPRRSVGQKSSAKTSLPIREHAIPTSQTSIDLKLLRKVRHLESVGAGSPKNEESRSKEHSSLKEKLNNMFKNHAESCDEKPSTRSRENPSSINENNNTETAANASAEKLDDDDEDIEVLRRLALETKQKKTESKTEPTTNINSENIAKNTDGNLNDDNDNEAYELRLIALRSAIVKNHENRVKRGVKPKRRKKSRTRVESPFGTSFLDEITVVNDEPTPRAASPLVDSDENLEDNRSEDMDLDTDVEREKEEASMPYSPTDDPTSQIPVDDESPCHVLNDDETALAHCRDSGERRDSVNAPIYVDGIDTPYSPSAPTRTPVAKESSKSTVYKDTPDSPSVSDYEPGIDTPYSPSAPIKKLTKRKSFGTTSKAKTTCQSDLSDYEPGVGTPYSSSRPIAISPTGNFASRSRANIPESPYSPTDMPIYDLALSPVPADIADLPKNPESRMENVEMELNDASVFRNLSSSMLDLTIEQEAAFRTKDVRSKFFNADSHKRRDIDVANFRGVSLFSARVNPENPIEAIRSIEELPETDLDGSPLVPLSSGHESAEVMIPVEMSPERVDAAVEPLYLQGLPDVTKDTNKIPTLVNRTLVPAPILKTNKNLQQPLPQKRFDNHMEPSFKSAEMLPVSMEKAPIKSSALFKPIKLCPVSKKPQVMMNAAAAFDASFGEESAQESQSNDEPVIVQIPEPVEDPPTKAKDKSPAPGKSQKIDEDSHRNQRKRSQQRAGQRKRKSTVDRTESSSAGHDKTAQSDVNASSSTSKQGKSISTDNSKYQSTRDSSCTSESRSSGNRKEVQSRRSKSKQTKLQSSKSNRANLIEKSTQSTSDETPKKSAKKLRRERRLMRKAEAQLAAESTSRHDDRATKSTKESSPGDGISSGVTRVESSSSKKSTTDEPIANETSDKKNNETNSTVKQTEKDTEADKKRRCSLDDDEETLRALLLASLPKRQKIVVAASKPADAIARLPQLSDSTTTNTSAENSACKLSKEPTADLSDSVFTPINPPALSSQSSSANSATPAKIALATGVVPKKIEAARRILTSESSSVEASSPRKRVNVATPKGPPKKIAKKALPVIASTKVVNNAKKYQNAMLQKKLNLQRAATMYSAQNGSRNITLNNLKANEAARPTSPKITAASKMQRLVINLGSDTDTESEQESQPAISTSGSIPETRKPLAIPTTDFEKSVEQFLRDQRKKHDSVTVARTAASATSTSKSPAPTNSTGKLDSICNTPLAVRRHLPMSQQEEYRRLKQQIIERERQKLQKTVETSAISQNRNCRSPFTPPDPLSPASPIGATQRTDNTKVSSVPNQVTTKTLINSPLAPSRDNASDNSIAPQRRINLTKSNENQPTVNATKVPAKISPGSFNAQLANPTKTAVSPRVNSSNFIVINAHVPKSTTSAPAKISPKVNSVATNVPKIPVNSSASKVPARIFPVASHIARIPPTTKSMSLPPAKNHVVAATEKRRNSGIPDISSVSMNAIAESSKSVSAIAKERWSLGAVSIASASTSRTFSAFPYVGTTLNPTELTIQIPNDKVRVNDNRDSPSSDNSESASMSPTNNCRSVGRIRVLTAGQLNNRFAQIQVERGPAGRRVTVGGSSSNLVGAAQSLSSPILKIAALPCDKTDKTTCCDSSLIINERNAPRRRDLESSEDPEKITSENITVTPSEASTLIVSRNEGNPMNLDSAASTFVVCPNSESRDNLETTRTESSGPTLRPEIPGVNRNKPQAKEVWDKIRTDVTNGLEILIAERKFVLEDLTDISGRLRDWETELEIQTKFIAAVHCLREQLGAAEDRLHEQRRQMDELVPKMTSTREKINRDLNQPRTSQGPGTEIIGEDYKLPNTGTESLDERLKEVAPMESTQNPREVNAANSSIVTVILSDSSLMESPSNAINNETEIHDNGGIAENSGADNPVGNARDSSATAVRDIAERDIDDSSLPEIIPLVAETENANLSEVINPPRENEETTSKNSEKSDNEKSETLRTVTIASSTPNACSKVPIEYISLPGTSKSDPTSDLAAHKVDRYISVLAHLKIPRSNNPDGILCPYELMGTCNDGDCQFHHLDPDHCQ